MKTPLTGLFPDEIAATLDVKPYQGAQLFRWIHQKRIVDFDAMSDLSKALRARLAAAFTASQLTLDTIRESEATGTRKALLRLPDGDAVECVLIRDRDRITLCLSSQAGCPLRCAFCATGAAGYRRNLDAGEIVEQALWLLRDEDLSGRTPNIVYMGMGEPFYNYDAVLKSIRLIMHPQGLHIGARKITVSTAGDIKGIERFAEEDWQVRLSVSLHAANNELRSRLVPLNKRYPVERLRAALQRYQKRCGRQVTLEWVLLDGVNDSACDADELAAFARGLDVAVNLIPWNPVPELPFAPSPPARCQAFQAVLRERGITATIRKEKGQDIEAACGQLRGNGGACAT